MKPVANDPAKNVKYTVGSVMLFPKRVKNPYLGGSLTGNERRAALDDICKGELGKYDAWHAPNCGGAERLDLKAHWWTFDGVFLRGSRIRL